MSDTFGALAPRQQTPADPEIPGQRPLVGGGLRNALAMLLQSSPVVKAQNYGSQLLDAAKLPGDLYSGRQPSYLGLRREDFTDDHNAPDPNEHLTRGAVSLADAMSMGSMPMAAIAGAERSALGIGVPPRIGRVSELPTIAGENTPIMARVTPRDIREGSFPPRPAYEAPVDPRGPWGQELPPRSPWGAFFQERPQVSASEAKANEAIAAIQSALKSGRPQNSGVPLVNPTSGPKPTTEEVLRVLRNLLGKE